MKELNFQNLYKVTVFLLFAFLLGYLLIVGQTVIVPLMISMFIAFLLIPMANFLERHKFPRTLAAIVSVIAAILFVAGLFIFFGAQIKSFAEDFGQVSGRVDELKAQMPDRLRAMLSDYSIDGILEMVKENFGKIFSGVSGFLGSFTFVFIVPVYIALIMIYRDLLRNFLIMVFKNKTSAPKPESKSGKVPLSDIERLIPKIRSIVQKYIVGMFYVMCILFVLYSTALISLGLGHAILFAALAAALNIIPYVGPFLGAGLPIMFALLTKDSLFYPIAVLGAFVVIQSVEGNLLTPKIVGNNVSLNPLITLITLFVGASIWGVVGMILFIPMVAILKEIFKSIDGLEPYAYVLGTGQKESKEPGWISKTWSKLVKKIKK